MSRRRPAHVLEYCALLSAAAGLRLLPHSAALRVGAGLGSAAYHLVRVRRAVAETNAAAALKLPPHGEAVRDLVHGCYRNLGMSLAELARLPVLGRGGLDSIVSIDGLEHLNNALCEGRGAVLATGHFGNWELMGAALAQRGYPMNFLVGHQSNRMVDNMLNSLREDFGIGLVRHGAHVRKVLRLLSNNQFVAMLCDHDAGRKGLMITFFGMPASSAFGPAGFALRSGAPIVMGFISRNGRRHRVELTPPIRVRPDLEPARAVAEATQRLADIVESRIRSRPDHWYWVHRRWKTSRARGLRSRDLPPADPPAPREGSVASSQGLLKTRARRGARPGTVEKPARSPAVSAESPDNY